MTPLQRRVAVATAAAVAVLLVIAAVVTIGDDGNDDVATSGSSSTVDDTQPGSSETSDSDAATTTDTPATTGPPGTTTAPTPTTTRKPLPPYRSSIEPVTAEQLGSSYTAGRGCTEPEALRAVNVTHVGYDGAVHDGRIIVATDRAEAVAAIFGELYVLGFPIERIVPVDAYGADDQASMRANNTSGYNCRTVAGTSKLSNHAFGLAIDVNPLYNPYVRGSTVDPPEGRPWADRTRQDPGMLHGGDPAVEAFERRGWKWGGYWSNSDYQHFSTTGT